jgi:hypothetical protein
MARSISEIQSQIEDYIVLNFATVSITIDTTQWSKRNILRLIAFCIATGIGVLEQLMDVFKTEIEDVVSTAAAASFLWVQAKMFQFQYSATDPQIVQIVDVVPNYPTIDETLRVITACSVKKDLSNNVNIKVATGNPLAALNSDQLSASQSYINTIGVAGINYVVSSIVADKIFIQADIWFKGEFSTVIAANVISALNSFLSNLSITNFDGGIKVTDIENCILNVEGVTDVLLKNVSCRADSVAFGSGESLVLNQAVLIRLYNLVAGYAVQETTASNTFADTLNFIAE